MISATFLQMSLLPLPKLRQNLLLQPMISATFLLDEPAPAAKTERTANRSGDKPKEKLNESRSMGVAGKEEKVNRSLEGYSKHR